MSYNDDFDRQFKSRFQTTMKGVRQTLWTSLAFNLGCLFLSVAGITLMILGFLRLFGVI